MEIRAKPSELGGNRPVEDVFSDQQRQPFFHDDKPGQSAVPHNQLFRQTSLSHTFGKGSEIVRSPEYNPIL